MKLVEAALLCVVFCPMLHCQAVKPTVRDKAVETIQATDDLEITAPESTYTLERLEAQKDRNTLWRLALSLPERQAATNVSVYLERSYTCRIQFLAGQYDQSRKCMAQAQLARGDALKSLGMTAEQVYPRVKAVGE